MDYQSRHLFLETLWKYYDQSGRHELLWRQPNSDDDYKPYEILVSELMLQQTQVARVIPKYATFLRQFPDTATLARATLGDVLTAWSGLGYNRRAKFLWLAAKRVHYELADSYPTTLVGLQTLPGVGRNTAGAIMAYTYAQPVVFIETNIRTVYIHHFFQGLSAVDDTAIAKLLDQTLDREQPREFYWALMDYGSHLKRTKGNASRRSTEYTRQSSFAGSKRQLRGLIIKLLTIRPRTLSEIAADCSDTRVSGVIAELTREGFIRRRGDQIQLG